MTEIIIMEMGELGNKMMSVRHSYVSLDKLIEFSTDPILSVSTIAREKLSRLARISKDPSELDKLSKLPIHQVKIDVTLNEKTGPETLDRLLVDATGSLAWGIVSHPNVSIPTLIKLTKSEHSHYAKRAKENLASRNVLDELLGE